MKIRIESDLHFEFHKDKGDAFISNMNPEGVDVLLLCGDIATPNTYERPLELICERFKRVLMVVGNHELYGSSFPEMKKKLIYFQSNHPNFTFMDNDIVEIEGQRFLGTTLWFRDHPDNFWYSRQMNDFSQIKDFHKNVYKENEKAINFLTQEMKEGDIILTHHAPSKLCQMKRYGTNSLDRFYICEMDDLILERNPKIWTHGHQHQQHNFMLGETRIISNPFGYKNYQENKEWIKDFVVEV